MIRLNFREACLLAASGELGPAAHREFVAYLRENPTANLEYQAIRQELELLRQIPPVDLSAADRLAIPAAIKAGLLQASARAQREKRAARRVQLIRYALVSVASAAAALTIVTSIALPQIRGVRNREREQVARIDAAIDRVAILGDQPVTPYDQAVTDVEASIRQLQAESPTLAEVSDRNMGNLLNVLAASPQRDDGDVDPPAADSPGSL